MLCSGVSHLNKENGKSGIASTMPFTGGHHCLTRLGSGSKCKRPSSLVLTMTFVTDRGSSNFCRAIGIVFKCFIIDSWFVLYLKMRVYIPIFRIVLVKPALADTSCCLTSSTGVYFQTVNFCWCGRMASICSSTNTMPKSPSIASFSTTVNSNHHFWYLMWCCPWVWVGLLTQMKWRWHFFWYLTYPMSG